MEWILDTFRANPALAIFLTLGLGFLVGKLKFKSFTLGTVTSVLLVGVLVGQMDIPISEPLKSVSFLLFLFTIGYSVGPQFFAALRGTGIKQVLFAVCLCVTVLLVTWGTAKAFGYNVGEAAGLLSGASTISAVIGVSSDFIGSIDASAADKKAWVDIIPVCYAVTYIFGTIGSAYILGVIGPMLLGGVKKVRQQTAELAATMNQSSIGNDPALIDATRPIVFRAYKAGSEWFDTPHTIAEIEERIAGMNRRIFVERVRSGGKISDPTPDMLISKGDEIVLSGRREFVIEDESWIGPEVADLDLLHFPVEQINVLLTKKKIGKSITVEQLRARKSMYGISISAITRGSVSLPVYAQTVLVPGDTIRISGLPQEVKAAVPDLGYGDKPTVETDMVFVGLGLVIGILIGALTLHIGKIPISLSTSGGALISGLVLGWLRTKRPSVGHIPQASAWLLNNLGLNMFIAVIGIVSGPSFVSGIKEVGFMLFLAGIIATTVPLIIGIFIGDKIFKFHPAINLGCCAGARTTTAALGAIEESLQSPIPAMGYTVTYAIGNTLLILWGVAIVLMMT